MSTEQQEKFGPVFAKAGTPGAPQSPWSKALDFALGQTEAWRADYLQHMRVNRRNETMEVGGLSLPPSDWISVIECAQRIMHDVKERW